jgi:hypothetical protein
MGQANSAGGTNTTLTTSTPSGAAFKIVQEGAAAGLRVESVAGKAVTGSSSAGDGVIGTGSGRGVWGHSYAGSGVYGSSFTGWAGNFSGRVFTKKYHELQEMSPPPNAPLHRARLFVRDNGSGKTELCVKFHTGGAQVLATET